MGARVGNLVWVGVINPVGAFPVHQIPWQVPDLGPPTHVMVGPVVHSAWLSKALALRVCPHVRPGVFQGHPATLGHTIGPIAPRTPITANAVLLNDNTLGPLAVWALVLIHIHFHPSTSTAAAAPMITINPATANSKHPNITTNPP